MSYQEECEWFAMYGSHAEEHEEYERGAENMELCALSAEADCMAKREWEIECMITEEEAKAYALLAPVQAPPVAKVEAVSAPADPNEILF